MTRLISFGVLLGLVVIFGLLSFRVMAGFLLPMLLAAMLVVIFGPMHRDPRANALARLGRGRALHALGRADRARAGFATHLSRGG